MRLGGFLENNLEEKLRSGGNIMAKPQGAPKEGGPRPVKLEGVQGSAKRRSSSLVNFVPAVA